LTATISSTRMDLCARILCSKTISQALQLPQVSSYDRRRRTFNRQSASQCLREDTRFFNTPSDCREPLPKLPTGSS
jgi:hypothetical protein